MTHSLPPDDTCWRPRLSLRTALLLTTIFALSILVIRLWQEVGPLRTEVRRLRDLTGVLSIEDPSKIYAIQVQTVDDLTWKWRVWVPAGRRIFAKSCWGNVPRDSFPHPDGVIQLSGGDNWITLSARKDPGDGSWKGITATGGAKTSSPIGQSHAWLDQVSHGADFYGVGMSTALWLDEGKPFLLLNYRVPSDPGSGAVNSGGKLLPGFVIWLESQ